MLCFVQFDDSDKADSSEVEDRRGSRFPGGRVGAGVGGLGLVGGAVYLVLQVLASGGNQTAGELTHAHRSGPPGGAGPPGCAGPPGRRPGYRSRTSPRQLPAGPSGSCRGVDSVNDPAKFIVCVETNVQAFWRRQLPGARRAATSRRSWCCSREATPSGCGMASARPGRSIARPTSKVYLDLGFFRELQQRFHARGGDFAEAYVVAHEYGHHVQDLLGTERRMRRCSRRAPTSATRSRCGSSCRPTATPACGATPPTRRARSAAQEIAEALDAAAAVGDDRIQKEVHRPRAPGDLHPRLRGRAPEMVHAPAWRPAIPPPATPSARRALIACGPDSPSSRESVKRTPDGLERWPRGRRRRFAKPLYGPKAVSRVRIPPSPLTLAPRECRWLQPAASPAGGFKRKPFGSLPRA